jgi:sporulation protein YlmC with PRC-barrel domain
VTSTALRPAPRRILRRPLPRRRRRRVTVDAGLISVAGAVGSPVYDGSGKRVGLLDDIVVRWDSGDPHPPLSGAVVRVRRKQTFVSEATIAALMPDCLRLGGPLELRPPERQPGLVALAHDVLDRQIVDVDGTEIVRVSDLVLGRLPGGMCLVGADVSARTFLRRLGPASLRRRVAVERVFDWASVAAFSVRGAGEAGSVLRLTNAAADLRALGRAELDTLLGDLPPRERDQVRRHVASRPEP